MLALEQVIGSYTRQGEPVHRGQSSPIQPNPITTIFIGALIPSVQPTCICIYNPFGPVNDFARIARRVLVQHEVVQQYQDFPQIDCQIHPGHS